MRQDDVQDGLQDGVNDPRQAQRETSVYPGSRSDHTVERRAHYPAQEVVQSRDGSPVGGLRAIGGREMNIAVRRRLDGGRLPVAKGPPLENRLRSDVSTVSPFPAPAYAVVAPSSHAFRFIVSGRPLGYGHGPSVAGRFGKRLERVDAGPGTHHRTGR